MRHFRSFSNHVRVVSNQVLEGQIQVSYIDKCIGDCVKKGIDKYPLDQLICILSRCLDGPDERKEAELRAETNKL